MKLGSTLGTSYPSTQCLVIIAGQGVDRHHRGEKSAAELAKGGSSSSSSTTSGSSSSSSTTSGSSINSSYRTTAGSSNSTVVPYRLIASIQDMLIEDFYPPIHSSTVPDNPGRLYIHI